MTYLTKSTIYEVQTEKRLPKITITCEDGAVFTACSYEDLVRAMKLDLWLPPETTTEYMGQVSKRCEIFDGSRIEYRTAEEFIEELRRVERHSCPLLNFSGKNLIKFEKV